MWSLCCSCLDCVNIRLQTFSQPRRRTADRTAVSDSSLVLNYLTMTLTLVDALGEAS